MSMDTFNMASGLSSNEQQQNQHQSVPDEQEEVPEVNISINNVVCSYSVRCHINLKRVAMESINVIYKRQNNVVNMKLRKPAITANIWSSGKITCTGATSEEDSKIAARRVARILQKLGYRTRFSNYRVVNVLGTCAFPWGIKLQSFASAHPKQASYEPELHPGATFKLKEHSATLKVFSTGSITVTAPSVYKVQMAIQQTFSLVYPHRLPRAALDPLETQQTKSLIYNNPCSSTDFSSKPSYKDRFTYKKRSEESDDEEESFGEESSDDSD